jgi:hypothetical protein
MAGKVASDHTTVGDAPADKKPRKTPMPNMYHTILSVLSTTVLPNTPHDLK